MSTTYQFQDILIFETSYIHDRFLIKKKTKTFCYDNSHKYKLIYHIKYIFQFSSFKPAIMNVTLTGQSNWLLWDPDVKTIQSWISSILMPILWQEKVAASINLCVVYLANWLRFIDYVLHLWRVGIKSKTLAKAQNLEKCYANASQPFVYFIRAKMITCDKL